MQRCSIDGGSGPNVSDSCATLTIYSRSRIDQSDHTALTREVWLGRRTCPYRPKKSESVILELAMLCNPASPLVLLISRTCHTYQGALGSNMLFFWLCALYILKGSVKVIKGEAP